VREDGGVGGLVRDLMAGGGRPVARVPWREAWAEALYGPSGFFTSGEAPHQHFRTAVHAAPGPLATALARLAERHGCRRVLDVGTGRGELLVALAGCPEAAGLQLHGADVVDRPTDLPEAIGWSTGIDAVPDDAFDGALVVAWELLDDVPCTVLELDDDGAPHVLLVDPRTGRESLGPAAPDDDLAWCHDWWPLDDLDPGDRIEVGRARDDLWADLVGRLAASPGGGALLAVDYSHTRDDRPRGGTLAGYRLGRVVPPVPDGACNVTAHVALDAVAAAGTQAAVEAGRTGSTELTDQHTALRDLGLGAAPSAPAQVGGSGIEMLRRLSERSQLAELLDPRGLGGFGWLLHTVAARE
jgi:hypothetical protein